MKTGICRTTYIISGYLEICSVYKPSVIFNLLVISIRILFGIVQYVFIYVTKNLPIFPILNSENAVAYTVPNKHHCFLFLQKNACCMYSLEAPGIGTSNKHHK